MNGLQARDEEHASIVKLSTTLSVHSANTSRTGSQTDIADSKDQADDTASRRQNGASADKEHVLIYELAGTLSGSHEVSAVYKDINVLTTSLGGGASDRDVDTGERPPNPAQDLDSLSRMLFEELSLLGQSDTRGAGGGVTDYIAGATEETDQQHLLLKPMEEKKKKEEEPGLMEQEKKREESGMVEEDWIVEQCITNAVKTTGTAASGSKATETTRRHRLIESPAADTEPDSEINSEHRLIGKCASSLSTSTSPSVGRRADKLAQELHVAKDEAEEEHSLIKKFVTALSRSTSPAGLENKPEPPPVAQAQMVRSYLISQSETAAQSQKNQSAESSCLIIQSEAADHSEKNQSADVEPLQTDQSVRSVPPGTDGSVNDEDVCEHSLIEKFLMTLSTPTSPVIDRKSVQRRSDEFNSSVETERSFYNKSGGKSSVTSDDLSSKTDGGEHSLIVRYTKTLIEEKCQPRHFSRQSSTQSSTMSTDSTLGFDPVVEFYEAQRNLFIQLQQKNLELRRLIAQMRLEQMNNNNNNNHLSMDNKESKQHMNEKISQTGQSLPPERTKPDHALSEIQNEKLEKPDSFTDRVALEVTEQKVDGVISVEEARLEQKKGRESAGEDKEAEKQDEEKRESSPEKDEEKRESSPQKDTEERIRRMQELVLLRQHKEELSPKLELLQQKRTYLTQQLEGLITVLQQQQNSGQEQEQQQEQEQVQQKQRLQDDLTTLQMHHEQQLQTLLLQSDKPQSTQQSSGVTDPDPDQRRQEQLPLQHDVVVSMESIEVSRSYEERRTQEVFQHGKDEVLPHAFSKLLLQQEARSAALLKELDQSVRNPVQLSAMIEPDEEQVQELLQRLNQQQQSVEVKEWLPEQMAVVNKMSLTSRRTTTTTTIQQHSSSSSFTKKSNIFYDIDSFGENSAETSARQHVQQDDSTQDSPPQDLFIGDD